MKAITLILALAASLVLAPASNAQDTSGSWTKKTYAIKGTWSIKGSTLTLTGLSTKNAPDLKLFLSPKSISELNNKNATSGSKLIAPLKSNKGDQTYAIPSGTDLSKFKTLIIHCQKFSKLWGAASL